MKEYPDCGDNTSTFTWVRFPWLNNQGRGTRVEINPVDQARVEGKRQRDLSSRSLNVRGVWDRAVDAWMADDVDELDAIWDEIIQDIGTDWDAYSNVSSIGWAA